MQRIKSIVFPSLPSTNDWAKQNLHLCSREGITAIRAEEQTAGRGRMGRSWHSPKNTNLYLTLVWFPQSNELLDPITVTHLLAYSVIEVLPELPCMIKWPNDLLCNGKKIAGILCETVTWQDLPTLIVGIGVNVQMSDLSAIDQPATSILLETGELYPIAKLSEQLTAQFQWNVSQHLAGHTIPFLDSFCAAPPITEKGSAIRETTTDSNPV